MDDTKLRLKIYRWLDGVIEPQENSELQAILASDAHARDVFLKCVGLHAELCNSATAQNYLESIQGLASVPPDPSLSTRREENGASRIWRYLALAATVVIAVGLWRVTATSELQTAVVVTDSEILDTIKPLSTDCVWYVEQSGQADKTVQEQANSFLAGDVIRLSKGRLELQYTHGTSVVLHAPAAYQLITDMKSRVLLGRLTATVPTEGIGFSVLTPRATVIDLGTEFGVEVNDDGATDVVVFNGEVDVDYNDHTNNHSAQRLRMGEAVRLDAVGTASRIAQIDGQLYSKNNLQPPTRPAVISGVFDNIARDSTVLNYYEIVAQGMQEDAPAFVDRLAHQWNGIDSSGMPPYLVGADYVKTFNSDKFHRNIGISVVLSAPCDLYILFDDRLPTPAWLQKEFQDTGDNIGMDTGPFHSPATGWQNMDSAGVGPGESVEDTLSVWVKKVSEPSTILLGSTVTPQSHSNMYGIVAVPLTSP
ncbi:FecR family protein [Adhaeretor mobilis]|uniref:FecR protein n=1 Tax=Adhaeretor mobilis TaxID=1930276 RepID=A0A517N1D4_9BACT|nr:FecR family protein [Adhaeretor mobilis]QDT00946.1 FecR protein [Adhaeretor mobilis]